MFEMLKLETFTGIPAEVASRAARPNPSVQVGITIKSASRNIFFISSKREILTPENPRERISSRSV